MDSRVITITSGKGGVGKTTTTANLLTAAQTRDKNAVNSVQMEQLCQQLRQEFDFVVIDSPAGIEQGFRNAIVGADEIVIVANPEMASVRDADRIIGLVEA